MAVVLGWLKRFCCNIFILSIILSCSPHILIANDCLFPSLQDWRIEPGSYKTIDNKQSITKIKTNIIGPMVGEDEWVRENSFVVSLIDSLTQDGKLKVSTTCNKGVCKTTAHNDEVMYIAVCKNGKYDGTQYLYAKSKEYYTSNEDDQTFSAQAKLNYKDGKLHGYQSMEGKIGSSIGESKSHSLSFYVENGKLDGDYNEAIYYIYYMSESYYGIYFTFDKGKAVGYYQEGSDFRSPSGVYTANHIEGFLDEKGDLKTYADSGIESVVAGIYGRQADRYECNNKTCKLTGSGSSADFHMCYGYEYNEYDIEYEPNKQESKELELLDKLLQCSLPDPTRKFDDSYDCHGVSIDRLIQALNRHSELDEKICKRGLKSLTEKKHKQKQ